MKTTSPGSSDRTIARLKEHGADVNDPLKMLQPGVRDTVALGRLVKAVVSPVSEEERILATIFLSCARVAAGSAHIYNMSAQHVSNVLTNLGGAWLAQEVNDDGELLSQMSRDLMYFCPTGEDSSRNGLFNLLAVYPVDDVGAVVGIAPFPLLTSAPITLNPAEVAFKALLSRTVYGRGNAFKTIVANRPTDKYTSDVLAYSWYSQVVDNLYDAVMPAFTAMQMSFSTSASKRDEELVLQIVDRR